MHKFVYVRRLADGMLLDIPAEHLESTLRRGGFIEIKDVEAVYETSTPPAQKPVANECPICGKTFKNAIGLAGHKRSHK